MNLKKYQAILYLFLFALGSYSLHKILFLFLKIENETLYYALETLYLLFASMSIMVLFVLIKVKEKSFDNTGMSFLLATSIKMVFCFIILRPLLMVSDEASTLDKKNFFALFILFLTIETIITIRLLAKKQ
jgi:hypothetical protein